jgi:hypothetical protein
MGWKDKVKLFMNVHDALEFYVHRSLNPADVIAVLQPAVIFPVPGWPMMKADWHLGKRWGSVKEIELLQDGKIKVEDGPELSPGTLYLPTLETEEMVVEETKPSYEEPYTYLHLESPQPDVACGVLKPHGPHTTTLAFTGEQPVDVPCKGYVKVEDSKVIKVELTHMPTGVQFSRFLQVMEKVEGSNKVEIVTPEGPLELEGTTGIDPDNPKHVGVVSLALGGAKVSYAVKDVDLSSLAADIQF